MKLITSGFEALKAWAKAVIAPDERIPQIFEACEAHGLSGHNVLNAIKSAAIKETSAGCTARFSDQTAQSLAYATTSSLLVDSTLDALLRDEIDLNYIGYILNVQPETLKYGTVMHENTPYV